MYIRFRAQREDRDLSQKAIADMLHIGQTTYSDYELGKLNMPMRILRELALYYDTSIDYLLELTDEIKPYKRCRTIRK